MDLFIKDAHLNPFEKMLIDENFQVMSENETKMLELIKKLFEIVQMLDKRLDDEIERNKMLSETVYKMAPELEVIDTMAEDEDERQELIDIYMNHRDDYMTVYEAEQSIKSVEYEVIEAINTQLKEVGADAETEDKSGTGARCQGT